MSKENITDIAQKWQKAFYDDIDVEVWEIVEKAILEERQKHAAFINKVLDRINEGLQTGETRDALVEAKYLLIDGR